MKNIKLSIITFTLIILSILLLSSCAPIPENCKTLEGNQKDVCIVEKAVELQNADYCKNFNKDEAKNNWCYTDLAKETNNIKLCNKIINEESKEYCQRDLFLENNNLEGCSSLSNLAKDDCYQEFAVKNDDYQLCLKAEDSSVHDDCLLKFAKKNVEPSICLEMTNNNLETKDHCIYAQSIKKVDLNYCDQITSESQRNACFFTVTVKLGDPSKCDELVSKMTNLCKQEIAKKQAEK